MIWNSKFKKFTTEYNLSQKMQLMFDHKILSQFREHQDIITFIEIDVIDEDFKNEKNYFNFSIITKWINLS